MKQKRVRKKMTERERERERGRERESKVYRWIDKQIDRYEETGMDR